MIEVCRSKLLVQVSSPHVSGVFPATVLPDDSALLSTPTMVSLLLTCSGAWRLRQLDGQWQAHGPNSDWVDVPQAPVNGETFHRLDASWQWRPLNTGGIGPVAMIPRARSEPAAPNPSAPATAIRPAAGTSSRLLPGGLSMNRV